MRTLFIILALGLFVASCENDCWDAGYDDAGNPVVDCWYR